MDLTTFETSKKYNILVGEAVWPIAKSLPKTLVKIEDPQSLSTE